VRQKTVGEEARETAASLVVQPKTASDPLEPLLCPFCGSSMVEVCGPTAPWKTYHVRCNEVACGCDGPGGMTRDEAIEKWNAGP